MKEFEGVFQEKDKMEISIQKKQQKEKELVGKIIPHEIPNCMGVERKYVGSYRYQNGEFMGHIFERIN
jgi:hypothetical protein